MHSIAGEKQIAVKLSDETIESLDKYAKLIGKTRHQLIKDILEIGVAEIKDLEFVGLFQLGMMVRDLHKNLKGKLGIAIKTINEGEGKPIPVKLSESFISRLDELAAKGNISRHQLMKNLINVGVEHLSSLEKFGIIKVAHMIRDLNKGFKTICDLGKKAFNATD
jgi:predicted transcriptional regulator